MLGLLLFMLLSYHLLFLKFFKVCFDSSSSSVVLQFLGQSSVLTNETVAAKLRRSSVVLALGLTDL